MLRPSFRNIGSSAEFDQWYWSKAELLDICVYLGLSTKGNKTDLRQRVILCLELKSQSTVEPTPKKNKDQNPFDE